MSNRYDSCSIKNLKTEVEKSQYSESVKGKTGFNPSVCGCGQGQPAQHQIGIFIGRRFENKGAGCNRKTNKKDDEMGGINR